ncbi:uncharacterized protein MONOS_11288 [Monocercomonoides exilis]|uniref:uncharacterized protein n=1 Tax=Monocercomonoides exilis TaxID=2049356 RepID=UPI00355AA8E1|nr:hypothetical protein MONOS_11288 [Monocercomonoides exilis]|eukprot:MONOS_11288.1-p1 / transcript=MONOS_11288.1 / gene=MONOS_11288 / organism=Monocercomonoides_exilis_PA203 / gene_product=unspecified product / transcript_product=unspecified product / location=Mono_scaffold00559:4052-9417(+) / protein_length=1768 / sequence_SO=supercontig / SO=protein_coding / is_pseudo=false
MKMNCSGFCPDTGLNQVSSFSAPLPKISKRLITKRGVNKETNNPQKSHLPIIFATEGSQSHFQAHSLRGVRSIRQIVSIDCSNPKEAELDASAIPSPFAASSSNSMCSQASELLSMVSPELRETRCAILFESVHSFVCLSWAECDWLHKTVKPGPFQLAPLEETTSVVLNLKNQSNPFCECFLNKRNTQKEDDSIIPQISNEEKAFFNLLSSISSCTSTLNMILPTLAPLSGESGSGTAISSASTPLVHRLLCKDMQSHEHPPLLLISSVGVTLFSPLRQLSSPSSPAVLFFPFRLPLQSLPCDAVALFTSKQQQSSSSSSSASASASTSASSISSSSSLCCSLTVISQNQLLQLSTETPPRLSHFPSKHLLSIYNLPSTNSSFHPSLLISTLEGAPFIVHPFMKPQPSQLRSLLLSNSSPSSVIHPSALPPASLLLPSHIINCSISVPLFSIKYLQQLPFAQIGDYSSTSSLQRFFFFLSPHHTNCTNSSSSSSFSSFPTEDLISHFNWHSMQHQLPFSQVVLGGGTGSAGFLSFSVLSHLLYADCSISLNNLNSSLSASSSSTSLLSSSSSSFSSSSSRFPINFSFPTLYSAPFSQKESRTKQTTLFLVTTDDPFESTLKSSQKEQTKTIRSFFLLPHEDSTFSLVIPSQIGLNDSETTLAFSSIPAGSLTVLIQVTTHSLIVSQPLDSDQLLEQNSKSCPSSSQTLVFADGISSAKLVGRWIFVVSHMNVFCYCLFETTQKSTTSQKTAVSSQQSFSFTKLNSFDLPPIRSQPAANLVSVFRFNAPVSLLHAFLADECPFFIISGLLSPVVMLYRLTITFSDKKTAQSKQTSKSASNLNDGELLEIPQPNSTVAHVSIDSLLFAMQTLNSVTSSTSNSSLVAHCVFASSAISSHPHSAGVMMSREANNPKIGMKKDENLTLSVFVGCCDGMLSSYSFAYSSLQSDFTSNIQSIQASYPSSSSTSSSVPQVTRPESIPPFLFCPIPLIRLSSLPSVLSCGYSPLLIHSKTSVFTSSSQSTFQKSKSSSFNPEIFVFGSSSLAIGSSNHSPSPIIRIISTTSPVSSIASWTSSPSSSSSFGLLSQEEEEHFIWTQPFSSSSSSEQNKLMIGSLQKEYTLHPYSSQRLPSPPVALSYSPDLSTVVVALNSQRPIVRNPETEKIPPPPAVSTPYPTLLAYSLSSPQHSSSHIECVGVCHLPPGMLIRDMCIVHLPQLPFSQSQSQSHSHSCAVAVALHDDIPGIALHEIDIQSPLITNSVSTLHTSALAAMQLTSTQTAQSSSSSSSAAENTHNQTGQAQQGTQERDGSPTREEIFDAFRGQTAATFAPPSISGLIAVLEMNWIDTQFNDGCESDEEHNEMEMHNLIQLSNVQPPSVVFKPIQLISTEGIPTVLRTMSTSFFGVMVHCSFVVVAIHPKMEAESVISNASSEVKEEKLQTSSSSATKLYHPHLHFISEQPNSFTNLPSQSPMSKFDPPSQEWDVDVVAWENFTTAALCVSESTSQTGISPSVVSAAVNYQKKPSENTDLFSSSNEGGELIAFATLPNIVHIFHFGVNAPSLKKTASNLSSFKDAFLSVHPFSSEWIRKHSLTFVAGGSLSTTPISLSFVSLHPHCVNEGLKLIASSSDFLLLFDISPRLPSPILPLPLPGQQEGLAQPQTTALWWDPFRAWIQREATSPAVINCVSAIPHMSSLSKEHNKHATPSSSTSSSFLSIPSFFIPFTPECFDHNRNETERQSYLCLSKFGGIDEITLDDEDSEDDFHPELKKI